MFRKRIEFSDDLTKTDYVRCSKDHPLTSIDLGLVNDFISVKFASLVVSVYSKEKEEPVN